MRGVMAMDATLVIIEMRDLEFHGCFELPHTVEVR